MTETTYAINEDGQIIKLVDITKRWDYTSDSTCERCCMAYYCDEHGLDATTKLLGGNACTQLDDTDSEHVWEIVNEQ